MRRLNDHVRYINHADAVQQGELVWLVERASLTEVGRRHDFSTVRTYADFCRRVPLCHYEDIRPAVMRMINGAEGVLWPGRVRNFAQSSGTSGGKSKYIPSLPVKEERVREQPANIKITHYLCPPSLHIPEGAGTSASRLSYRYYLSHMTLSHEG